MAELFCENSERLKTANNFRKKKFVIFTAYFE